MSIYNAKISVFIPILKGIMFKKWLKVGNYLKIGLKR